MISDLVYYTICASTVAFYGVGLGEGISFCSSPKSIFAVILKSLFCSTASCVLTWLLTKHLLCPNGLSLSFPFFGALIFLVISVFTEILVRVSANIYTTEFSISLLCVILSVTEGDTLVSCILICCVCLLSFFIFTYILSNIRRRLGQVRQVFNADCLLYVSVALLLIATFAKSVSWLNG